MFLNHFDNIVNTFFRFRFRRPAHPSGFFNHDSLPVLSRRTSRLCDLDRLAPTPTSPRTSRTMSDDLFLDHFPATASREDAHIEARIEEPEDEEESAHRSNDYTGNCGRCGPVVQARVGGRYGEYLSLSFRERERSRKWCRGAR